MAGKDAAFASISVVESHPTLMVATPMVAVQQFHSIRRRSDQPQPSAGGNGQAAMPSFFSPLPTILN
jgi:hypothetical protein